MIRAKGRLRRWMAGLFVPRWIAIALALAAAGVFLATSIHFAGTQRSTIDEGLYLYKGYLYATGEYEIFQPGGPRAEYGPLSYLVPGAIQAWFGPGLLTGRIFAILLGVLALGGLWAAARRLAGPWWAALVLWAAALNPAVIRFYSFGLSQGLVTCLLVWMLYFALDERRSTWQASLSVILAALILLTRQNMAPVLPVVMVYIFWQFGRRTGLIASLAGVLTLVAGHALFWPGILMIWAPYLPASLTPFLDAWRVPAGITPALEFSHNWVTRLYNLLEGFRFHFLALSGSILGVILWPARKTWKGDFQYRAAVFLTVLFFSLTALHIWAGLGFGGINFGNAFTVNPYLAFFSYSGLLVCAAIFSNLPYQVSVLRQVLACVVIVLIAAGVGYGGFLITSDLLLNVRIPRLWTFLSTGKLLPWIVPVWDLLATRFDLPYERSRWLVPLLAGLLGGGLVLLVAAALQRRLKRRRGNSLKTFGGVASAVFLSAGLLLSPSLALGGGFVQWNCDRNVIRDYEQAGRDLNGLLQPDDTVYWEGGNAVALLLYTPGIRLQPQELDWQWNYFLDGDLETLAQASLWNPNLAAKWRQQATVILLQTGFVDDDWRAFLEQGQYSLAWRTSQPLDCSLQSELEVYRLP